MFNNNNNNNNVYYHHSSLYSLRAAAAGSNQTSGENTLARQSYPGKFSINFGKQLHWWQRRPILGAIFDCAWDDRRWTTIAAILALTQSLAAILFSCFDAFCLIIAQRGATYHWPVAFAIFADFRFVYVGNEAVRRSLIATAAIVTIVGAILAIVSVRLIVRIENGEPNRVRDDQNIRNGYQASELRPWLAAMFIFVAIRFVALIFQSIANDLYFRYHLVTLLVWLPLLLLVDTFAWLVVYSAYQLLIDLDEIDAIVRRRNGATFPARITTIDRVDRNRFSKSSSSLFDLDQYSYSAYVPVNNNNQNNYQNNSTSIYALPAVALSSSPNLDANRVDRNRTTKSQISLQDAFLSNYRDKLAHSRRNMKFNLSSSSSSSSSSIISIDENNDVRACSKKEKNKKIANTKYISIKKQSLSPPKFQPPMPARSSSSYELRRIYR